MSARRTEHASRAPSWKARRSKRRRSVSRSPRSCGRGVLPRSSRHSKPPMSGNALAGRGIVITRPARQAVALAALIEAQGARAILFPVMEILDIEDRGALEAIID